MQIAIQTPSFFVKDIPVYGDLIFAPMDGISSHPFRSLLRSLGSAMSYTEFIPAVDAIYPKSRLREHTFFTEDERPVVFQLLDNHPERLARAAEKLLVYHPDAIDINLGCPARDIANRGAGSGLMRQPNLVAQIFSTLSKTLPIPVTAKIRLGWDQANRNYLEIAHAIQENGGALLAVHGRTREQAYSGEADWDAIAAIKQNVSIPVIANGDVRSVADIQRIKAHTQCDGVMIGRAALSNPWIFSRLDRCQVTEDQLRATITEHLKRMVEFYGPDGGLVRFRKHILRYLEDYVLPADRRMEMVTGTDPQAFQLLVMELIATSPRKRAGMAQENRQAK